MLGRDLAFARIVSHFFPDCVSLLRLVVWGGDPHLQNILLQMRYLPGLSGFTFASLCSLLRGSHLRPDGHIWEHLVANITFAVGNIFCILGLSPILSQFLP